MKKTLGVTALASALILVGCTTLIDIPVSELEPGDEVVIKQPEGKLEGKVWSVDEDTAVVVHDEGDTRKRTEIDLTDDELEILVRQFSWAKTFALGVGAYPFIVVAVVVLLSIIFSCC